MIEVLPVDTPTLGDRSYLAHDGNVALVIDPQRDIDRISVLAAERGVRITHVAETHAHNDYVSGGLALSRATGARYLVNAADPVGFACTPIGDGDILAIGASMRLRVLATPGHTFTHLSYVVEAAGAVTGVFTGGSLLYGSTGRPDLLGPDHTGALARAQYASARRLAGELPDSAEIFPTHGFGSFCAATQSTLRSSTIGREKLANPVLTRGEQDYVEELIAGLDAWPAYYAHTGAANIAGPAAPDLSPPRRADAAQVRCRIQAGEWVVDLRDRVAFAAGFVPGSVSFPLDGSFATYLGWAIPWNKPVTLLGETPEQVSHAQRELVRIGIDRPAAAATGRVQDWAGSRPLASLRLAKFGDLAAAIAAAPGGDAPVVIDVRRRLEWEQGHIAGAAHIPFNELPDHLGEIPSGEVWVHCQSGYRAVAAASMLAARGRPTVGIDDDFGNAKAAGLALARHRARMAPSEGPRLASEPRSCHGTGRGPARSLAESARSGQVHRLSRVYHGLQERELGPGGGDQDLRQVRGHRGVPAGEPGSRSALGAEARRAAPRRRPPFRWHCAPPRSRCGLRTAAAGCLTCWSHRSAPPSCSPGRTCEQPPPQRASGTASASGGTRWRRCLIRMPGRRWAGWPGTLTAGRRCTPRSSRSPGTIRGTGGRGALPALPVPCASCRPALPLRQPRPRRRDQMAVPISLIKRYCSVLWVWTSWLIFRPPGERASSTPQTSWASASLS